VVPRSRVEWQVDEGYVLEGVVISKGRELDGIRTHLIAQVVYTRLPADQVFGVLDNEVR